MVKRKINKQIKSKEEKWKIYCGNKKTTISINRRKKGKESRGKYLE